MSTYYYKHDVTDVSDQFKLAASDAFATMVGDHTTYDGIHYVDWKYDHAALRSVSIPEDIITAVEDGTVVPVAYLRRRGAPDPVHAPPFMVYAWRLQEGRGRRWWYWSPPTPGEPLAPWLTTEDPGAEPAPAPTLVSLGTDWDTDNTSFEGHEIDVKLPQNGTSWYELAFNTMATWPGACVGGRMEAIAEVHNYGRGQVADFIQYVLSNHDDCFEDFVRAMGGEVIVTDPGPGETRRGDDIVYDGYGEWVVVYDSEWGVTHRPSCLDQDHLTDEHPDGYIVVFDPRDGELRADARTEFSGVR